MSLDQIVLFPRGSVDNNRRCGDRRMLISLMPEARVINPVEILGLVGYGMKE